MQPVLNVGGNWNYGAVAGLWYWYGNGTASYAGSSIGGRILIGNILYVAHISLGSCQKTLRKEDGLVD